MGTDTAIKILYIDDEPNNLISFKAAFRLDYTIYLANNAEEAFKHLRDNPDISIIFCDQRMPVMTGVEFFEQVRVSYPEPVRILITGFTDIEAVIAAINKGHVFRYIGKPWNEADIHLAIDESHKFYLTSSLLKKKNAELQKAYNELDRFAYSATHDMRGPILSVLGILDLARNASNMEELREMLEMVESAMLKLDSYIRSLHEHYSIRHGELEFTEISFEDIIGEMQALFSTVAKVEGIDFRASSSGGYPFRSDLTSIKIIINNLLSNAFKYQREEEEKKMVTLGIETFPDKAVITISDNGMGIPENSLPQVFNMFFRATHEAFGTGFGLYNVKDVLDKLKGTIDVQSKEHEGTTFRVSIPGK